MGNPTPLLHLEASFSRLTHVRHTLSSSADTIKAIAGPVDLLDRIFEKVRREGYHFHKSAYAALHHGGIFTAAYVGQSESGAVRDRICKALDDPDHPAFDAVVVFGLGEKFPRDQVLDVERGMMRMAVRTSVCLLNKSSGQHDFRFDRVPAETKSALEEVELLAAELASEVCEPMWPRECLVALDEIGLEELRDRGTLQCVMRMEDRGLVAWLGTVRGKLYILPGSEIAAHHQPSLDLSTRKYRKSLFDLTLLQDHPTRKDAWWAPCAIAAWSPMAAARLVSGRHISGDCWEEWDGELRLR